MSVTYHLASRCGRFAFVRILPSGEAAGYDARSHRDGDQRHFRIYRDTPTASAVDAAFADSRTYATAEAAIDDFAKRGGAAGVRR